MKWAAPSSGALTHIQTTTFGAAATYNTSSVFSSTYANYRVIFSLKGGTAAPTLTLRMLTGTTTQETGSIYIGSYIETTTAPASTANGGNNTSSFSLGIIETSASPFQSLILDFMSPNIADKTHASFQMSALSTTGLFNSRLGTIVLNTSTQYTGFALLASTGDIQGGTVRVYGYSN